MRMQDLGALATFLERACAGAGADQEATSAVRLATEEVFSNIFRHGYGDRPGPVTVRVDAAPGRITVILVDAAPAFDPAGVARPDLDADWVERRLGGMGWHLVREVMDEVRREPRAAGGNVFTLVKKFPAHPPDIQDI
ncbi:ATP-binding protein [Luteimonas suaedae]|uniref:ATP-binding protein n=1 Tax=Luteimonas suaedae TaxID=2605430 RepID=UPI001659CE9C|nr:ATP-binding protein [Luteimonas suaedae]